jgi:putative copper resistance protein D
MSAFASFSLFGVDTPFFSFSALPLLGVSAAALLYLRACSILATRGRHVPTSQRVSYFSGLAMILVATQTFIDPVGEHALLSLHMLQHLLIADLPAPLLLYGVRAPVVYFFWPRPVMVRVARMTHLRSFWRWLRQPHVALTVWLVTLYAWHVPFFYEAALSSRLVHDLEHLTFALAGMLAWWPLMDPTHERFEGRVWKAAYIVVARILGGILGIVLIANTGQIYGAYGTESLAYGIDPIVDQQIAGAMMMLVDSAIVIVASAVFLLTIDRGSEYENDLLEPSVAAAIARARAESGADEDPRSGTGEDPERGGGEDPDTGTATPAGTEPTPLLPR